MRRAAARPLRQRGGFGRRFLFVHSPAQHRIERPPPAARQQQRAADPEHRQRQLDPANRDEGLDSIRRNFEQGIGQLDDERGDEHRRGEEEGIETGEQAGEEQDGPDGLGVRRDVSEEGGDAVVLGDPGGEGGGSSLTGELRPAVGEEDQRRDDAQQQRGGIGSDPVHAASSRTWVQRVAALDRVVAPLALFICFYVATLILLSWLRFPFIQWLGLISVSIATALTVAIWDRGRWPLGLFVPPRLAVPEFLLGSAFGAVLVGMCAALVIVSTAVWHERGAGFPWREVLIVFIPAAVHEELLFRGYAFQKLHQWHRGFALFFVAIAFAALHYGNAAVSWLGLTNIFLGGILLGLAYERHGRLWFPIGLHLAWNIMSGPILGHEVSGYDTMATVLVERGNGPGWLTGGEFGIEGSVWMTLTELAGIAFLALRESQSRKVVKSQSAREHPL